MKYNTQGVFYFFNVLNDFIQSIVLVLLWLNQTNAFQKSDYCNGYVEAVICLIMFGSYCSHKR